LGSIQSVRNESGTDYVLHPEWVGGEFMFSYIDDLLRMGYDTAKYGWLLYERIGKIELFVEGERIHEFDLAQRLKDARCTNSFTHLPPGRREAAFRDWKIGAWNDRLELGLPVVPFEGEEQALAEEERLRRGKEPEERIRKSAKAKSLLGSSEEAQIEN